MYFLCSADQSHDVFQILLKTRTLLPIEELYGKDGEYTTPDPNYTITLYSCDVCKVKHTVFEKGSRLYFFVGHVFDYTQGSPFYIFDRVV